MSTRSMLAVRGSIVHCLGNPAEMGKVAIEYFADGVLLIADGKVQQVGDAQVLLPSLSGDVEILDRRGKLIMPGFIDTHIHYPQTDIIASYGEQLLDWLNKYTFPAEREFANEAHAAEVADFFLQELLRNGTTTAMVMGTVHSVSVDAFFKAAQQRDMRMIAGKVLMDRHAPEYLQDTAQQGYDESLALIESWHGQGRLSYAITPRFAPTSTEAQLELAGALAKEHPTTYIHTHVAENPHEVEWVASLFPQHRSYLDVYDHHGLLRERSNYAHCIYLDDADRERMAASQASMAFCPTSNLFLGSGLFDHQQALDLKLRVGLATDVGGGSSFNMLQTANEAYKVQQLNNRSLTPEQAFYLLTLGGAHALFLDDVIGNFAAGKEADFLIIDPDCTPLMRRRMSKVNDLAEQLFVLMMLGDDRAVAETYIHGRCAYQRDAVI